MHLRIRALVMGMGALALLLGSVGQAKASLITSLPGGTVVSMPVLNVFGPGPESMGSGITWSSTNASNQGGSVFGYTNGYGFGSNGFWDGNLVMAGLNDAHIFYGVTDTMTFAFANPVSAVGGFINYYPDGIDTPTTIAVYDSSNNLIESATLSFSTGGGTDSGFFYGFQEGTANISYFSLSDNYIGLANLTIPGAVPEPASLTLLGLGVAGIAVYGFRRRQQSAKA
jgi:hypothetical protein